MKKKIKDRHLDVPSEANRDKHINFVAIENKEIDPSLMPSNGYLASNTHDEYDNQSDRSKKKRKH